MSGLHDADLWERFCQGDEDARRVVLSFLVSIVERAVKAKGGEDFDDEVFFCTLQNVRRRFCERNVDLSQNPAGFIYMIARTCVRDHRPRVRVQIGIKFAEAAALFESDPARAAESEEERAKFRTAFANCLSKLPDSQRVAVEARLISLVENADLTFDELAKLLGVNLGTLWAQVAAALPKLRRCLKRSYPDCLPSLD